MNTENKPLVIIESPFAGDVEANISYARKCVADSLSRNEAPICSHLLFPQLLDDTDPAERALGIEAGLAWYRVADKCVVYADRGYSKGMAQGQLRAAQHAVPVEVRYIEREAEYVEDIKRRLSAPLVAAAVAAQQPANDNQPCPHLDRYDNGDCCGGACLSTTQTDLFGAVA